MGFPNRRTILREAEEHVGAKYVDQVLDSLYVIEKAMRHFFLRAGTGKAVGRSQRQVDEDYKQAAACVSKPSVKQRPRRYRRTPNHQCDYHGQKEPPSRWKALGAIAALSSP
jgi:hypothetical protein